MKNIFITLFLFLPILAFGQSIQRNSLTTNSDIVATGIVTNIVLSNTVAVAQLPAILGTNNWVVTNAGTATGVTIGTNGNIAMTGGITGNGNGYFSGFVQVTAQRVFGQDAIGVSGMSGFGGTGTGSNIVLFVANAAGAGTLSPNGSPFGGIVSSTHALDPEAAYRGIICTNGYSAMWNSNGVVYLRSSVVGATTSTDTKLSP